VEGRSGGCVREVADVARAAGIGVGQRHSPTRSHDPLHSFHPLPKVRHSHPQNRRLHVTLIILRILHIVTGVFWAGAVFFIVSFLLPTFKTVGPDAGKVFAELRRRNMFTWLPSIALVTILTGLWMYMIRMGSVTNWASTREAMALGGGAAAAILAFLIGTFVMRTNTLKAADEAVAAMQMAPGAEKDARMAAVQAMRARAGMAARIVATLLLIAVVTMAIARYLV